MLLKMVDLLYYLHFSRSSTPGRVDFVSTSSCFFSAVVVDQVSEGIEKFEAFHR